jgi:hypothetical protein
MGSVATDLRREDLIAARGLSPADRLDLALRLGDSDLALRMSQVGGSDASTRRALEQQRSAGRRASRCAAGR